MNRKYGLFIILFFIAVWLINPAFDTIDDFFMQQIVSGKYGHYPSELMLYSSPLYGKVLMLLYKSLPSVNWYFLILLIFHLFSWLVILDVFIRHNGNFWNFSVWIFVFLFATFGLYFLGNLQFTTTAFILAMSGLMLIMNKKRPVSIIAGILMVLLAAMIRLYSVWFLLCLTSPWLLYRWVLSEGFKGIRNQMKTILIITGILFTTVVLIMVGKYFYRQTESGKVLRSFIIARGRLIDNPNFIYTPANFDAFRAAGWTEKDYKMFSDYFFDPAPPFNPERLNHLKDHLKIIRPDHSRILTGIEKLVTHYQFCALVLLLIIIVFTSGRITGKDLLFAFLQTAAITTFVLYLLFFNDFKLRVLSPVLYSASLFSTMHLLKKKEEGIFNSKRSFTSAIIFIALFITVVLYLNYKASTARKNRDLALRKQIAIINGIEKDWLVVHGYDLPVERMRLSLLNYTKDDLKGNIYFTMPSCFSHYLTGSRKEVETKTVFDLLSGENGRIVLLHKNKTTGVEEIMQYSSKRSGGSFRIFSRIDRPGLEYELYMRENQNR